MESLFEKINQQDVISSVITSVVTALVMIVLALIGKLVAHRSSRLRDRLVSQKDKPVPTSLRTFARHVTVMACLLWMLQATMRASGPTPGPMEVALIAAWTWATLSYLLHAVRER